MIAIVASYVRVEPTRTATTATLPPLPPAAATTRAMPKPEFRAADKTHTSLTLFCPIPPGATETQVVDKFSAMRGFQSHRRKRNLLFMDFETKQHATDAMTKLQRRGVGSLSTSVLRISYDKDDMEERGGTSRRAAEQLKQHRKELEAGYTRCVCAAPQPHAECLVCISGKGKCYLHSCGGQVIKLVSPFSSLPRRKTDGAAVVDLQAVAVSVDVAKGALLEIPREKGIEKQWRIKCMRCDAVVGYRTAPHEQPSRYLFLMPRAVHELQSEESKLEAAAARKREEAASGAEVAADGAAAERGGGESGSVPKKARAE